MANPIDFIDFAISAHANNKKSPHHGTLPRSMHVMQNVLILTILHIQPIKGESIAFLAAETDGHAALCL